jgi:hypothetical protein
MRLLVPASGYYGVYLVIVDALAFVAAFLNPKVLPVSVLYCTVVLSPLVSTRSDHNQAHGVIPGHAYRAPPFARDDRTGRARAAF